MTDEEMARLFIINKYDLRKDLEIWAIKNNCELSKEYYAYIAGLKAGKDMAETDLATVAYMQGAERYKPKWHKVTDGDLPKSVDDYVTNIGVLTYDDYGNGVYKWHTPYCEACDYTDEVEDDEVIAWCEIPKYTEE